jgi:hypothetical protein
MVHDSKIGDGGVTYKIRSRPVSHTTNHLSLGQGATYKEMQNNR